MKTKSILAMMALAICVSFGAQSQQTILVNQSTYDFSEEKINTPEIAIKAIEKMIKSQGEKFTPNQLEITTELISYSKEVAVGGGWGYYGYGRSSSTVAQPNSIYFDLIDIVKFRKKKRHWEVMIHSKTSGKWKIFFSWDFQVAEDAAIGFAYLTKLAKNPN